MVRKFIRIAAVDCAPPTGPYASVGATLNLAHTSASSLWNARAHTFTVAKGCISTRHPTSITIECRVADLSET